MYSRILKCNVIVFKEKKANNIISLFLATHYYMKSSFLLLIIPVFFFAACKTGSKTSINKIVTAQRNIMPSDSMIQKQKKGIDLIGTGNTPSTWSLEIDFDKIVSFTSGDGNNVYVLPAFEKKEPSSEIETYRIKTDLGPMIIEVYSSVCPGTGIGEQFNKKIEVTIKGKRYTGCGKYLFDHRLNDSWILESVNNKIQSAADFSKGLPRMELNLLTNKMNGSDGCNNINSTIEVKGNRIKFSLFASTRMACNNTDAEKIFSTMVSNKLVDYYMENNKLILYLEDDSKLYFKRRDL